MHKTIEKCMKMYCDSNCNLINRKLKRKSSFSDINSNKLECEKALGWVWVVLVSSNVLKSKSKLKITVTEI